MSGKLSSVNVELTPGTVMTDQGLHRPLVYKDNSGNVFIEAQKVPGTQTYFVPDLQIRSTDGGNFLTGDFDLKTQDDPIGIAVVNSDSATGENVNTIATGVDPKSSNPNPLSGGIGFHSLFFAAWQRNANGTIKLNEGGRPMPALDANGNPMVGPLILHWNPRAIRVKNPTLVDGSGEAQDLVYKEDPEDENEEGEFVYIGAWGLPSDCGEGLRQGYYDFGYAGINK